MGSLDTTPIKQYESAPVNSGLFGQRVMQYHRAQQRTGDGLCWAGGTGSRGESRRCPRASKTLRPPQVTLGSSSGAAGRDVLPGNPHRRFCFETCCSGVSCCHPSPKRKSRNNVSQPKRSLPRNKCPWGETTDIVFVILGKRGRTIL